MADELPLDNVGSQDPLNAEEQTLKPEMNPVMSDSDRDVVTDDEDAGQAPDEPEEVEMAQADVAETPDSPDTEGDTLINVNTSSPSDQSDDVQKRIEKFSKQRTKSLPPKIMAPTPPTDSPVVKPNPLLRTTTPKAIAPKPPAQFPGTTSQTVLMGDENQPKYHDLSHVACFLSFFLFWTVFAMYVHL